MRIILFSWIFGSAIFFLGWFLGILMAKQTVEAADREEFCEACYLRAVAEQLTGDRVVRIR